MKLNNKNIILILTLISISWGLGISLTNMVIDAGITTYEFIFIRFLLGLSVVTFFYRNERGYKKSEILLGIISGMLLFLFFTLQTIGLSMTTVSNTALYTGSTALIKPFISKFISGTKIKALNIVAAMLLLFAIFINNDANLNNINLGHILVLISAFLLSLNISIISKYKENKNLIKVTIISLFTCCILAFLVNIVTNPKNLTVLLSEISSVWWQLMFLGVITTAAHLYFKILLLDTLKKQQ